MREAARADSDRWASISDSAVVGKLFSWRIVHTAVLFYFLCLLVIVRDARMNDGTAWRKGRDTKTAWEGVVMVCRR